MTGTTALTSKITVQSTRIFKRPHTQYEGEKVVSSSSIQKAQLHQY